ncbi:MAG: glycosyltransferase [Ilumatobacteraceae bacterium]
MRILHVTAHYPPDFVSGATLQVRRLAVEAARQGHEVTVLAGAIDNGAADGQVVTEFIDGVSIRWLGTASRVLQDDDRNWQNERAAELARSTIDDWRPDILHAHALQTLGPGPLEEAVASGVPTVVTMHDLWWWCARLFLVGTDLRPCPLDAGGVDCPCARDASWRAARAAALQPVLTSVDLVLTASTWMRERVIAAGVEPARVELDENDVDPAAVPVDRAAGGRRQQGDAAVRFVYVGGANALKGADVLLAASEILRREPGWRLTACGISDRRSWRRPWRRPPPAVTLAPAYPPERTAEIFAAADVLVIPSIARESYSLAAREALAAGLAVITTDCRGPEEVVRHGVNGLVVPAGDPQSLADAMRSVVDDRHLLADLRAGASSTPVTLRDPIEHAATLVERYRRLIGRAKPDT